VKCLPIAAAIVSAGLSAAHAEGTGVLAGGAGRDDRALVAAALVEAIGVAGSWGVETPTATPAGRGASPVGSIGPRGRVVADAVGEARAQLAAGAVPLTVVAQFRRVREMIDEGWRAYLRVQIDFAQSRLAAARHDAEALVALPGGPELYADAALRLGAVLQHRRLADAPAVLALALALDPARPITLAEFSPDVVDAVDAVRAAPVALQHLHVAATPAGAMISIDGNELGRAPLDAQVTRGQHLVIARAPLSRAAVQGVVVDGPATVELALERDEDALRLAEGAAPGMPVGAEQALVDSALELADLDEVVVAAVSDRRGGPTLLVQRCAGLPVRCTAVVDIGFGDRAGLPAAAREAWRAVQAGELRYPPSVIGDSKPQPAPSGCRLCRSPLVWTGVGAVVLGAVIAIVVSSSSRSPPVLTVDGHDFGR